MPKNRFEASAAPSETDSSTKRSSVTSSVSSVAEQALIFVAASNAKTPAPLVDAYLMRLHDASIGRLKETCADVADSMMADGIRSEDIADRYVPAVARKLGEEWSDDDLSFASVSIGSARLQALLRRIGPDWSADSAPNPLVAESAALVIVTAEVHHTLGSMVLAGQLRRAGLSVRLVVGAETSEVVDLIRDNNFAAVLISASITESMESLKTVVKAVRSTVVPAPPIVIGGTVLDQVADVQTLTGADLATTDVREALEFCDLISQASTKAAFMSAV